MYYTYLYYSSFVSFHPSSTTTMESLSNDLNSQDTVTSRASIASTSEITEDPASTFSFNLTPDYKHTATQSLTGHKHVTRVYTKYPHFLPLACLALVVNPPLGFFAFVCAILSRKHRFAGNEHNSSRFSNCALWISLVAIASSVVIIVFTIVYIYVITPNIVRKIEGWPDTTDYDALSDSMGDYVYNSTLLAT